MRISDWSSDVCSSDLAPDGVRVGAVIAVAILLEDAGLAGRVGRAAIGLRDLESDFALAERIEDGLVEIGETDTAEHETLGLAEARRDMGRRLVLLFGPAL